MARRVLYSPGFGAGWSSWADEHGLALATDPELVRLCEAGEVVIEGACTYGRAEVFVQPAFLARLREICGEDLPYCGGLRDLRVCEVSGPFRIEEYDGAESVIEPSDQEWL